MKWKDILLGGVAFTILAEIVHIASSIMTMGYYIDPAYFALWSKVMMPAAGPPPATYFYISIAFAFVTGCIYAWAWNLVKKSIAGKGFTKGVYFGLFLFLLAGLPMTMMDYLLFNIPLGLLTVWTLVDGFLLQVLTGVMFAKMMP